MTRLGRFTRPDSIVPSYTNPQSLNRFGYAANNPLKYVDPTGHWPDLPALSPLPSWVDTTTAALGPLNPVSWAAEGYRAIERTQQAIDAGVTEPWQLALHATGVAGALVYAQNGLAELNADTSVVFSDSPLEERLPHAVHLGIWATGTAATVVSVGQLAAKGMAALGSAPCSFSADTEVATDHGLQPIGTLQVGDHVLAYAEALGMTGIYTITAVLIHQDLYVEYVTINGEQLATTPEHPFYTIEHGWQPAGWLQTGEHVRAADGHGGVVQAVTVVRQPQVMYNLTVAKAHTFFVGHQRWLVHNVCGTPLGKPVWPNNAAELNDLLGMEGKPIPDGPKTLGRGKMVWAPSDKVTITGEAHPYDASAPDFHRDWHWHLDIEGVPGWRHVTFLPGEDIPGY